MVGVNEINSAGIFVDVFVGKAIIPVDGIPLLWKFIIKIMKIINTSKIPLIPMIA